MELKIEPLERTHFDQIFKLINEFAVFEKSVDKVTNSIDKMYQQSDYIKGFVAVDQSSKVIGYCIYFEAYFTWVGKCMYMDDLYVKEGYRSMGVGRKLIQKVIDLASLTSCNRVRWQVSHWNDKAQAFYKELGAEIRKTEYNCDFLLE